MLREEAIKYLKEMKDECNDTFHNVRYVTKEEALEMAIQALEQEPKTGHWIKSRDSYGNNHFTCPFCKHDIATKYAGTWKDNYCSNCGAKMVEQKESEG